MHRRCSASVNVEELFLYYITDRGQLSGPRDDSLRLLLDRISAAARAGIDAIQIREKDLAARELVELGTRAVEIVRGVNTQRRVLARTKVLVNSRIDVAIACGADGVHLRSDDVSAADTRAIFAQAGISVPMIGVSCHTVQDVLLAEGHGADLAVYGPVFGKAGSEAPPTGLAALQEVCRRRRAAQHPMPVLALGEVTLGNAADCLKAGAHGVAGIRLFQNGSLTETVTQLQTIGEKLSL